MTESDPGKNEAEESLERQAPQDPERSAESDLQRLLHGDSSISEEKLERIVERYPEFARQLEAIAEEMGQEGAFDPALADESFGLPETSPDSDTESKVELAAGTADLLQRLRLIGPRGDRYRDAGAELGRGGMGVVRHVQDADLNRKLAMKVLFSVEDAWSPSDQNAHANRVERFLEEAQITAQLDHPGIVPVHELGLGANGRLYFTMKAVRGQELTRVFERVRAGDDKWSVPRALDCLLRVCEAMAYAHEKGVIHRDLKPANVLVGRFGAVYVMDWGLAKLVSKDVASAESEIQLASPGAQAEDGIVGSLFYMSPEQARGENDALDERTDVYSFGAMLYELLVGHPPYSPPGAHLSQTQMLLRIREGPPPPPEELAPDMPSELCAICDKAMAYRLEARYADMIELARDLRAYLERRVVRAHGGGALAELKKWISRNRGLSAAIVLSAVLAIVALFSTLLLVNENRFQAELEAQNAQLLERDVLATKAIDDLIEMEEELRELRKTRDDFYRERLLVEGELAETASLLDGALVEIEGWRARLSRAQALARAALVPWSEALAQRADESVADALDELVAQTQPRQRDLASDTARVFMLELVGRGLLELGEAARAQPHLSEALQLRRVALPHEERELFALTLDAIQAQIRAHADDENAEAKVTDLLGEAEKLVGRLEDPAGSHADRFSATRIEVAAWRRRRQ